MKEDLIADIWTLFVSEIPVKSRLTFATDYVNLLSDNGVTDSKLKAATGVDPHLDEAISTFLAEEDLDSHDYDDEIEDDE